jgi:hypothetical protein
MRSTASSWNHGEIFSYRQNKFLRMTELQTHQPASQPMHAGFGNNAPRLDDGIWSS